MTQKTSDKKIGSVFGKVNYLLMLAGIVLMVLGYLLMIGGGSNDPNVFNPEIFSPRRLTLAPILIFAGIVVNVIAILYKSNRNKE
jgi:membrane-bound ClpP family serine protease